METLELKDIQGIIIRGYSNLPAAAFLLLQISNAALAKTWLQTIVAEITPGDDKKPEAALNVALTFNAMQVLGLDRQALDTFPLEFEDGMTTNHKQLFLGDYGDSAPENWLWGGKNTTEVHILLMLYAADAAALESLQEKHISQLGQYGLTEVTKLDTSVLYERKEHFGFQDGISQPTIKGLTRLDEPENMVSAGEFILGYKNEYNQHTPSPVVAAGRSAEVLPVAAGKTGKYDLGKEWKLPGIPSDEAGCRTFLELYGKIHPKPTGRARRERNGEARCKNGWKVAGWSAGYRMPR